jgi:hypothetical protein
MADILHADEFAKVWLGCQYAFFRRNEVIS